MEQPSPSAPSAPDPALREAARCPLLDHDPEAWIRCCTARFLPVARRVARDDAAARDALQQSWLIVMQKIRQYRGGPPACGWVAGIVRHEVARAAAARSRRREVSLDAGAGARRAPPLPAAGASPETAAAEQELMRLLLAVIDELPPKYRQVLRYRDIEERSTEDVAHRLHISRRNVATRLNRAHGLLRQLVARRLAGVRAEARRGSADAPAGPSSAAPARLKS